MNGTHVAFLAFTRGQYTPILIVHERPFLYGARRKDKAPRVSVTAFSVPCASIALATSHSKGRGQLIDEIFLGLSDGTLMRLPLFEGQAKVARKKKITVYPRLFILEPLQPVPAAEKEPETGGGGGETLSETKLSSVPSSSSVEKVLQFDQTGLVKQLEQTFPDYPVSVHPFGDGGHMRYSGASFPLLRIVVKGQRAVVSGTAGIFVFKLDKQPDDKERVVHMQLSENSGFDFRGGLLAILKHDTSIQMLNLNTHKLEVEMEKYSPGPGKGGLPSYAGGHVPVVRIHDERIVFFHADGSLRAMEYVDTTHLNSPFAALGEGATAAFSAAIRQHSFLPSNMKAGTATKKKGNNRKGRPQKKK
jgi:hypothetical protein